MSAGMQNQSSSQSATSDGDSDLSNASAPSSFESNTVPTSSPASVDDRAQAIEAEIDSLVEKGDQLGVRGSERLVALSQELCEIREQGEGYLEVERLLGALNITPVGERSDIFEELGRFPGNELAAGVLLDALSGPSESESRAASFSLRYYDEPWVSEPLIATLLTTDSESVTRAVSNSLLGHRNERATERLVQIISDERMSHTAWHRVWAAKSLAWNENEGVIQALGKSLREDSSEHVRIAAAESLGREDSDAAYQELTAAQRLVEEDENASEQLKSAIGKALWKVEGSELAEDV